MKYLLFLFSMMVFTKSCDEMTTQKEVATNAQDDITIQYEASSRGFYQDIKLSKEQFSFSEDRGGKASVQQEMSTDDWSEIIQLLDKIDSEKLERNYVNPDDLRRDAVIPAKLIINYKENVVTNVEFGHGDPPKELASLIAKIQAIAKAVDKP